MKKKQFSVKTVNHIAQISKHKSPMHQHATHCDGHFVNGTIRDNNQHIWHYEHVLYRINVSMQA